MSRCEGLAERDGILAVPWVAAVNSEVLMGVGWLYVKVCGDASVL